MRENWHIGSALVSVCLYGASGLYYTGGHFSLPLDDPFIYFQYARQAASGYVLQYNTGDAPTAGATSLLYMLLLVPAFWIGLDGIQVVVYSLLWGGVFLALCTREMRLLGRLFADPFAGELAGLLFALCGPLLWGILSGMEIGLFSFAILFSFRQLVTDGRWKVVALSLLVLGRPEGVLLYGLALLWKGLKSGMQWRLDGPLLVPLLLIAGQAVLYRVLTGDWGSAGMAVKWLPSGPHFSWPEAVREILFNFTEFIKGMLGGSLGAQTSVNLHAYDSNARRVIFAPLMFLFFAFELAGRTATECKERAVGGGLLAALWLSLGVLSTCTLVEYDAHFNRYQQPFFSLFLLFTAIGVARLRTLGGQGGAAAARGLGVFFVLWGGLSTSYFAIAYGENASDIHHMQMRMGEFIGQNVPSGERLAINDAGVLRYFGQHRTIDLVGLTSKGMAKAWRNGSGSIYEALERMPESARPTYFAVFPNWFNFPSGEFLRPVHSVRLQRPSIVDAEQVLYRADWQRVSTSATIALGDKPASMGGLEVVAQLDVADLQDEEAHAYVSTVRVVGEKETNLLLALGADDGLLIDGGRMVTGKERFSVRLRPDRNAYMHMRTATGVAQQLVVFCNGKQVGRVQFPRGPGRAWLEQRIAVIPPELHRGEALIEVVTEEVGGVVRPFLSFHYWFLQ